MTPADCVEYVEENVIQLWRGFERFSAQSPMFVLGVVIIRSRIDGIVAEWLFFCGYEADFKDNLPALISLRSRPLTI